MLDMIKNYKKPIIITLCVLFICLINLVPTFGPGWPMNHEYNSPIVRTEMYAQHIRQGDLFPLWSSSDAFGFGTPQPFFYHKTFYWVSGPLRAVGLSSKMSVRLGIAFFTLIGFFGIYYCSKLIGEKKRLILFGASLLLILSPYAINNWLTRGAVAEFSAMMLFPWLIAWAIHLIKTNKPSILIVPLIFLLLNAHSVLGLFGLFALAPFAIYWVIIYKKEAFNRRNVRTILISIGLLILLFLPQAYIYKQYAPDFNPSAATDQIYTPEHSLQPLQYYLVAPRKFRWLQIDNRMNLSLGPSILIFLSSTLLAFFLFILENFKHRKLYLKNLLKSSLVPITVCLLAYAFLLTGYSLVIYRSVPGLSFLQFVWRNMAFTTTLSILVGVVLMQFLNDNKDRGKLSYSPLLKDITYGGLIIAVFLSLATAPFAQTTNTLSYIPQEKLNYSNVKILTCEILGIGEYLPNYVRDGVRLKAEERVVILEQNVDQLKDPSNCTVTNDRDRLEDLVIDYHISCTEYQPTVVLPITYSSLHVLEINSSKVAYTKNEAGLIVTNVPEKETTIKVFMPSWKYWYKWF